MIDASYTFCDNNSFCFLTLTVLAYPISEHFKKHLTLVLPQQLLL